MYSPVVTTIFYNHKLLGLQLSYIGIYYLELNWNYALILYIYNNTIVIFIVYCVLYLNTCLTLQ